MNNGAEIMLCPVLFFVLYFYSKTYFVFFFAGFHKQPYNCAVKEKCSLDKVMCLVLKTHVL